MASQHLDVRRNFCELLTNLYAVSTGDEFTLMITDASVGHAVDTEVLASYLMSHGQTRRINRTGVLLVPFSGKWIS
jgi:hypothetical protein